MKLPTNLQTRLLLAIGMVMLLVFAAVEFLSYQRARRNAIDNLQAQAEKVRSLLMAYRENQQKVFLKYKVPLTEVNLHFLPAFAIGKISAAYPNWDNSGFSFNNVSDQPRNPAHLADSTELAAMAYFRAKPDKKMLFQPFKNPQGEDYYLYARPIWIEEHCLKCHDQREDAPPTIRKLYDTAWNYKIGDLRGILSIKLPAATVSAQAWSTFKDGLLLHLAGFGAIFLLVMVFIRRHVTTPLQALAGGMQAVAAGDYQRRLAGFSGEFAQLGSAFNDMSTQVAEHQQALRTLNNQLEQRVAERTSELAEANQAITRLNTELHSENLRMSAELDVTRRLQQMLLPREEELAALSGLDISTFMTPANEVGGDYYDLLSHDGSIKIAMGDVTGHGLESGVLMLMVQTAVRTLLANNVTEPMKILEVLNRAIFANTQRMGTDKNLTLTVLDYHAGLLRLCGQHEDVLILRQEGKVERIDTSDLGFMVGLQDDIKPFLHELAVKLHRGDSLVLYTDGLTEAHDAANKSYGLDRLCTVLSRHWQAPAQVIRDAVISDVKQHLGTLEAKDDMTLVVIKQLEEEG